MKIPYNILIQIKMSVRPYFKGFTLIFFFYNCRKQDYIMGACGNEAGCSCLDRKGQNLQNISNDKRLMI